MAGLDAVNGPGHMSRLELVAESQAQESGFLALADIASLATETGIEYRVVGGLMVTLHLAVSGADDPTARQTLDADLGVTQQVAADPALVAGLEGLGYERPESANRFIRQTADGRRMVIDLLMPSYTSRMKANQPTCRGDDPGRNTRSAPRPGRSR